MTRSRYGRRRFLAGAAALGTAALATSCGGGSSTEKPAAQVEGSPAGVATAAPRKGGALRAGQTSDIALNSGYPVISGPQNRLLGFATAEGLVRYTTSLEPELLLAERFEYNSDRTGLTVTLKPGLQFGNGGSVTVDDMFFALDLLKDPRKFGLAIPPPGGPVSGIIERKKVDDRTAAFTFDRPRYDMTGFFADLMLTHAASFEKLKTGEEVATTGPYQLVKWTPGQVYRLEPNRYWHGTAKEGGPYLDSIEVRIFRDEEAMALAFEAGELELVLRALATSGSRFKAAGKVKTAPAIGLYYLGMNVTNPLLVDPRVRRALFLGIDRQRIADEVGEGFLKPTVQAWPAYSPAYDKTLDAPFYDPAQSKALLKEAGFSQSRPLILEYPPASFSTTAPIVKENWEAIGVKLDLVPTETNVIVTKSRNRQFTDLWAGGTNLSDPVPASALATNTAFSIPNPSHNEHPVLAEVIQKLQTLDPQSAEAKAQYARFNRLYVEEPWHIPLQPTGAIDLVSPKLQGFDSYFIRPVQSPNFGRMWLK